MNYSFKEVKREQNTFMMYLIEISLGNLKKLNENNTTHITYIIINGGLGAFWLIITIYVAYIYKKRFNDTIQEYEKTHTTQSDYCVLFKGLHRKNFSDEKFKD
jgi:hypothetical protein